MEKVRAVRHLVAITMVVISCGCAARSGQFNAKRINDRLTNEKRHLAKITDPVERTQSYIRIAQLLMNSVAGAARENDFKVMAELLSEYEETIRSAQDTLVNSGRDATEEPEGFLDLELALREETRHLRDISLSLRVDDRPSIEPTLETAISIRTELFRLIFPQTAAAPD